MNLKPWIVAFGLGVAAPAFAAGAPIGDQPPYAMIRSLQILQEQIAHGNGMAQAAQPKLMAHIAEVFLAADPDVWREPRNARAAILFLLSGGQPSVIRTILSKSAMPPETDKLLKGALAYGEGNDTVARQLLGDIEVRSLPSGLGGHLALVQAGLLSADDSARASKLLDMARLLVPGTLVEEAALRRQVFLLSGPDDFDRFVSLSRQYMRRFHASIYADNFKQRLKSVAIGLAKAGDVARLSKFDGILSEMPPAEQVAFYLAIAKTAIIEGKAVAARLAAEKASSLSGDQGSDGARSRLYAGAALIVSDDTAKGLKTLEGVDPSRLSAQDVELRDAALAVGARVEVDPAEADKTIMAGAAGKPPEGADPTTGALLERARTDVAATDRLLGASQP